MRERDDSPPEPKRRLSGDATIYVERPVPVVLSWSLTFAADAALCDELDAAGFIELEVSVTFDEGHVHAATLEDGSPIALDSRETENAEVDWSERCDERYEPEWDRDR